MRFLIISHTPHEERVDEFYAYEPYVREMNIWLKHVDTVEVVAPLVSGKLNKVKSSYNHNHLIFTKIPSISFTSLSNSIKALVYMPFIFVTIIRACKRADHIHLRCPGNIGLLGCIAQIFFPRKTKTAKYAGNWDPKSKQPLSYRFQKWLLRNTFFTKNIKVLVYGTWRNQSKNIKPFFTASFFKSEIVPLQKRDYSGHLKFVFVGSLVKGKRPLFAVQLIEGLLKKGFETSLDIYGDGELKSELVEYIKIQKLEKAIRLHGNQEVPIIKEKLQTAHFLILPSKSEGWPKAIAEAMFFGAIPIATRVSCVPDMLGEGERGILITDDLFHATETLIGHLKNHETLHEISKAGAKWAQNYTLDYFESEIVKLLKN